MHGKWVRKPAADAAVVFVHGILSSGETCWKHEAGSYWPHLLRDESGLGDPGIFVFSYETNIFSGSYDLSDIVDALKEWLRVDGVMACRHLVFVCHSMGGIVVRKFLVERASQLIDDGYNVGLYLVASPSLGSSYANWLGPLASLFGHSQAAVLRFIDDNPLLKDVDKTFKNLKEEGKLRLRGKEITEDKFVVLSKFLRKQVVQPFAGAVYFGEPFKVPGSDHFSIAKPASGDAIQHRLLVEFVKTFLRSTNLEGRLPQAPVEDDGRQPSNISSTLAAAAPSPVSQAKSRGVAELLQQVCSKDPYLAIPAAHELAKMEDLTEAIVDRPNRSNEMVPLAAVRIALAGSEDAADLLAARVLDAERDWHRAVAAAMDFDVSHRPFAAHRLGSELDKRGRDCTRVIMWSLGSLGAVEWSYAIRSFVQKQAPGPYSLDNRTADLRDYVAQALEGLTDIFRLTTSPGDIASVSSVLRDVIRLDEKHSTNGYGALKARLQLASCSGAHIDDLVRHWACDESARVRGMGADALGEIRAQRTIPRLEQLLFEPPRVLRRLFSLRGLSHEQEVEPVFTRGTRTRCSHGAGTQRAIPIAVGSH